ncbi:MAG: hypothetical protein OC190_10010 [Novosphingobium aromaticivorans]|nr:hypothetical protein [Novosphingobium aromaticivorans]
MVNTLMYVDQALDGSTPPTGRRHDKTAFYRRDSADRKWCGTLSFQCEHQERVLRNRGYQPGKAKAAEMAANDKIFCRNRQTPCCGAM